MNLKSTATFLFLFTGSFILSAQKVHIDGIIKDSVSDEPVPFAHVVVGQTVTLTNVNGEFVLSLDENDEEILQVSHMGYRLHQEEITTDNHHFEIYLRPSELMLEEVIVTTGSSLMEKVFSRIPVNYEHQAQNILSYYKEKLLGNDSLYYLAEGILDIYLPSNVSDESVRISPIKTRKRIIRSIKQEQVTLIKGHASDMVRSSIWREESFLSEKNRNNYDFDYSGKKLLGEHDVYIVDFTPKNSRGYISGSIYIEDETYAILKMEYYPDANKSGFWSRIKWTEEFDSFNGIYHLVRASYEGVWEEGSKQFTFSSLLVNNKIQTVTIQPAMGLYLGEKDIFFETANNNFSDSFWENYNFIKLDDGELTF